MDECLDILSQNPETQPGDGILVQLVRIQLVIEKLANIPLFGKVTALENSSSKSASLFYLKALKLQLEEVQGKIPLNLEGNGKL